MRMGWHWTLCLRIAWCASGPERYIRERGVVCNSETLQISVRMVLGRPVLGKKANMEFARVILTGAFGASLWGN